MNPFSRSMWIWANTNPQPDEYAEFYEEIDFAGKKAELYISSDSNYTVYVNGILAAFGQYADFPYKKVYDKIDLTSYVRQGKNIVAVRVWYYGISTLQTYCPGRAGVIFSLYSDGVLCAYSGEHTKSRISPTYVPHKCKKITVQLGLTFEYNSKCADAWLYGEPDAKYPFSKSYIVDISPQMRPRSCKMLTFGETYVGKEVVRDGIKPVSAHGRIFDLGREAVGFICLKLKTVNESPITVAFGEHLVDGHVRKEVGGRDFSFIYHPTPGDINYYMNAFRRCGCRYVELISDYELTDVEVSLRSVVYPLTRLEYPENLTTVEEKIYDACVYTMECCMHEHYEDCPWREQAFYTMDSRNQILSGYYAFGETIFPKSGLELISEDNRPDGLLSICYPMAGELAIPSFSLHYIVECEEYLSYSHDVEFIERIYPKIHSTLSVFLKKIDTSGLITSFAGKNMWNFYEWSDGLDGRLHSAASAPELVEEYHLALNVLLSYAITHMIRINDVLGKDSDDLIDTKRRLNEAIRVEFYNRSRGLCRTQKDVEHYAALTNSLCILAGVFEGREAEIAAERMISDEDVVPASLSMRCFFYDALIAVDKEKYTPYILSHIEKTYRPMIELGNGTVWETDLGESDFDNAGSLCHGWSAIPVYYYNLLK